MIQPPVDILLGRQMSWARPCPDLQSPPSVQAWNAALINVSSTTARAVLRAYQATAWPRRSITRDLAYVVGFVVAFVVNWVAARAQMGSAKA